MILNDEQIAWEIEKGGLGVEPINLEEQIQPATLDLRLGEEVYDYRHGGFNKDDDSRTFYPAKDGNFYLAHTEEYVEIPENLVGVLWDRSSVARKGVVVQTAGLVDPGFHGQLTLEVFNISDRPVELSVGQRVCQIGFFEVTPPKESYDEKSGSKYAGQTGVQRSKLEDHE